jgi:hypothetical protein
MTRIRRLDRSATHMGGAPRLGVEQDTADREDTAVPHRRSLPCRSPSLERTLPLDRTLSLERPPSRELLHHERPAAGSPSQFVDGHTALGGPGRAIDLATRGRAVAPVPCRVTSMTMVPWDRGAGLCTVTLLMRQGGRVGWAGVFVRATAPVRRIPEAAVDSSSGVSKAKAKTKPVLQSRSWIHSSSHPIPSR